MVTKQQARSLVAAHLARSEEGLNNFGSALPGARDRPRLHLKILDQFTQEHDFGWVFFYSTREFEVDGDSGAGLAGNAPLIVDRHDGLIYITGTAHPVEHYLERFRQGERVLAERADATDGPSGRR